MEIGLIIVAAIVSFFILRELFLWYWKINKIEALLEGLYAIAAFSVDSEKTITIKHKQMLKEQKTTIGKYLKMKNKSDYVIIEY